MTEALPERKLAGVWGYQSTVPMFHALLSRHSVPEVRCGFHFNKEDAEVELCSEVERLLACGVPLEQVAGLFNL